MYAVLLKKSKLSPSWLWTPLYPFQYAMLLATRIRPPFLNFWLRCSEIPLPSSILAWMNGFEPTQEMISL